MLYCVFDHFHLNELQMSSKYAYVHCNQNAVSRFWISCSFWFPTSQLAHFIQTTQCTSNCLLRIHKNHFQMNNNLIKNHLDFFPNWSQLGLVDRLGPSAVHNWTPFLPSYSLQASLHMMHCHHQQLLHVLLHTLIQKICKSCWFINLYAE